MALLRCFSRSFAKQNLFKFVIRLILYDFCYSNMGEYCDSAMYVALMK